MAELQATHFKLQVTQAEADFRSETAVGGAVDYFQEHGGQSIEKKT